jgi:uncharacterized protein
LILPDVNVLVHAYNPDFPGHKAAKAWWEDALNGEHEGIGLAWAAILGFIRITTNRSILTRPLTVVQATGIVRTWLQQEPVRLVVPGEHHAEILFGLLEKSGVAANLTTDAHIAALALEYRARVASTDTDFARFPGLKWFNPL